MNVENEAVSICLAFSNEIFHNPEVTNIIVRIKTKSIPDLKEELWDLSFEEKRTIREDKIYSIINFEKVYPFYC